MRTLAHFITRVFCQIHGESINEVRVISLANFLNSRESTFTKIQPFVWQVFHWILYQLFLHLNLNRRLTLAVFWRLKSLVYLSYFLFLYLWINWIILRYIQKVWNYRLFLLWYATNCSLCLIYYFLFKVRYYHTLSIFIILYR